MHTYDTHEDHVRVLIAGLSADDVSRSKSLCDKAILMARELDRHDATMAGLYARCDLRGIPRQ